MAKARPTKLVTQGQCKEDVSPQRSGSPVNQVNVKASNFVVESSQVHRQESVNLAARKPWQKDLTRPKCEEDSCSRGKPDAASPVMENMRFSDHQYREKTFQCIQKKLGRTSMNATFPVESCKNSVLAWRMFVASSMKAAIRLGQVSWRIWKSTRTQDSGTSRMCSTSLKN